MLMLHQFGRMPFVQLALAIPGLCSIGMAQPWFATRAELSQVVREEGLVSSMMDGVSAKELGLEAVNCRENRLEGQYYQVGFKNHTVEYVQFHPVLSPTQPNWYGALSALFGDHPSESNWVIDQQLTTLFPWITQSSLHLLPETKLGRSRQLAVNIQSGAIAAATSWQPDLVPTGRFFWNHSASHVYRYVFKRRNGQAYLIIEGNDWKSKEIVPNAVNIRSPFVHRPQDITNVMVATPDVFFGYLIRTCAQEIDNSMGKSYYDQQVAKFVSKEVRDNARRVRLAQAIQAAIQTPSVSIESIIASVGESDQDVLLSTVASRRNNSRRIRSRKLQFLRQIGKLQHLEYCLQFVNQPSFRDLAIEAMTEIAKREDVETPASDQQSPETWIRWAKAVTHAP